MEFVVFMRGVNLGGTKRFRPSALAADLADLAVTNIGAAGTLIVRRGTDPEAVRAEILRKLPFEPEMMICPAGEVLELAKGPPPGGDPAGTKRFVSVMATPPARVPRLPIDEPPGEAWEVRVLRVTGRYALTLRRGRGVLYPNEVVERKLGVRATTRGWETLVQVRERLKADR